MAHEVAGPLTEMIRNGGVPVAPLQRVLAARATDVAPGQAALALLLPLVLPSLIVVCMF